jgi:hypothetical protein
VAAAVQTGEELTPETRLIFLQIEAAIRAGRFPVPRVAER